MNKAHIAILMSVVLGGITGCASVSTPMKHADGRVINCSATGIGWIGAPAALVMRENCVSNARASGFVPIDEGVQAPASNNTTVNYSGRVAISLPDGWVRAKPPSVYTSAIDFAKNPTYDAFLVLSFVDKKQITDVSAYADTKKAAQVSKLRDVTATKVTQMNLKGRVAYVADIVGVLPSNGTTYHFRNTVIDGDGEILMLSVWTTAANYDGNVKEQLDDIANKLTGL